MTERRDHTLGERLLGVFRQIREPVQSDYALVPIPIQEDTVSTTDPAARNADPDTSHAAAASVRGTENLRSRIYTLLTKYPEGLTHEHIVTAYESFASVSGWRPATQQGIRSRVKELEREGRVRRSRAAQDRTANGRLTHRWFAVTDPAEAERLAGEQPDPRAPEVAREMTISDVPENVRAHVIERFLADLENEGTHPEIRHAAKQRELTEEQAALSATDLLSSDIRAARSAGAFTAAEIAEKLVSLGWHL